MKLFIALIILSVSIQQSIQLTPREKEILQEVANAFNFDFNTEEFCLNEWLLCGYEDDNETEFYIDGL